MRYAGLLNFFLLLFDRFKRFAVAKRLRNVWTRHIERRVEVDDLDIVSLTESDRARNVPVHKFVRLPTCVETDETNKGGVKQKLPPLDLFYLGRPRDRLNSSAQVYHLAFCPDDG